MKPQPHYKIGDKIGGRYQVHDIKMGGMGEVYLCLDLENDLPFALKTFQQRFLTNPKLRAAFHSEIVTWVALKKHPNIVRCFYLEEIDYQPFLLLEWVAGDETRGNSLYSWLQQGSLDLRTALDLTIDICRGLVYAVEMQPGIVHRDLKPDNILIEQGPLAKITDFGLAKIIRLGGIEVESISEARQGRFGVSGLAGTPPYIAPEQWLGDEVDQRTDLYALGCIVYEMLMGQLAFQATTFAGWRSQHLKGCEAQLSSIAQLGYGIESLLKHCLANERNDRFSSAKSLLEGLVQFYWEHFNEPPRELGELEDYTAIDYNNRGITYQRLGYHEKALIDFNEAINLKPGFWEAIANRGIANHRLGNLDNALFDFDLALKSEPNSLSLYNNRGNLFTTWERYDDALSDFNRVIALDPSGASGYANRGVAYAKLHRYGEARADFDRAISIDPKFPDTYILIGTMLANQDRLEDAFFYFEKAEKLGSREAAKATKKAKTQLEAKFLQSIAFRAFRWANSYLEMQDFVNKYPIMADPFFNVLIRKSLAQALSGLSKENGFYQLQAESEERIAWLEQATQKLAKRTEPAIVDRTPLAIDALLFSESLEEVRLAVTQYRFMTDPGFIFAIEHGLDPRIPYLMNKDIRQLLAWLRQVAAEQNQLENL